MELLSWPGKSADELSLIEHPAVYHMLDVAAVAEELLATFALPPFLRDAFILLIAFHDLGKINESFRRMLRGEGEAPRYRHWEVSEYLLHMNDGVLASTLGAQKHCRYALYAAVAGHHGRPSDKKVMVGAIGRQTSEDRRAMQALCGAGVADASEVVSEFIALWPAASLGDLSLDAAQHWSWWLAGLCTTADWIGSNTRWFAPQANRLSLADYLADARRRAKTAVEAAGLTVAAVEKQELFSFALRPMQQACAQIALPEGPMLAVIEDETGAGKTEAALLLAQRMLAAGKGRGLFFALPTMATADAMFDRAVQAVGRMLTSPKVTLAHGRAELSERFRDLIGGASRSRDDVTCTDWLADSRRRALLADVGVGTIDQALLSVLPVKFQALRLFALSSKILIVDEVHELGEPYIGAELEALLKAHHARGGSAILLTATLPLAQRARLLATYGGQSASAAYPALTIAGGAARTDFPQETGAKGPVKVVRLGSAEAACARIRAFALAGAACVWVRNSVDDAIAAVDALRAIDIEADLLHARMALSDRKYAEARAHAIFGKDGQGREGRVLVGTQVLESSLDFDFDVMVTDLAPMAALVQRAGRLWRHMDRRPRAQRPVAEPALHVLAPDPAEVKDERWLNQVLGGGAFVYPLADQWRTADHLFRLGEIVAPSGLRDLIEAVHGAGAVAVPAALEQAELKAEGEAHSKRGHAAHNIVHFEDGYRAGGRGVDDADYPTRLGEPQRTLFLARAGEDGLAPWAAGAWALSEVNASVRRLARLPLPAQDTPEIKELTRDWPDWKQRSVTVCPVGMDGTICAGLHYEAVRGLVFGSAS